MVMKRFPRKQAVDQTTPSGRTAKLSRHWRERWFPAALLCLTIAAGFTPSLAESLTCTFVDKKGRKIKNVGVDLTELSGPYDQHETSDVNGGVRFTDLAAGRYRFQASLRDYVTIQQEVEIAGDMDIEMPLLTEKDLKADEKEALKAIKKENYAMAVEMLQKLVNYLPTEATVHDNLARAYAGLMEVDKALAHAEKAAELSPKFERSFDEIAKYLGQQLLEIGQDRLEEEDYQTAVGQFERIVELIPQEAHGHYCLALAYGNTGRHKEGLQAINRALELDPGNPDYQQIQGILERNAQIE